MSVPTPQSSKRLLLEWCLGRLWSLFGVALAFQTVSALLALGGSWMFAPIFDRAIAFNRVDLLTACASIQLVCLFAKELSDTLANRFFLRHSLATAADLTERLYDAFRRQPLPFFQSRSQSDLMQRLAGDTAVLGGSFSQSVGAVLVGLGQFAIVLVVLAFWHPRIALLGLIGSGTILTLTIGAASVFKRRLERDLEAQVETGGHILRTLGLQGKLLVISAAPLWPSRQMGLLLKRQMATMTSRCAVLDWLQCSNLLTSHAMTFVLYLVGGAVVNEGSFTIGQLVVMAAILTQLNGSSARVGAAGVAIKDGLVRLTRLHQDLSLSIREATLTASASRSSIAGAYKLSGVSFTYPGEANGLLDVSVTIPPGAVTAVMGKSGAGKTTLASVLLQLLHPVEGGIFLDGRPLKEIAPESLHSQTAYVPQEPVLFRGTIRENLLLGRQASDRQIYACCEAVQILDRILVQPGGLDANVGEHGSSFSAGERQRLGLARALISNPTLLVLDEPTAHLDPATRGLVNRTIAEQARHGRTVVILCHELPPDLEVDWVISLDQGRAVYEGPPERTLPSHRNTRDGHSSSDGARRTGRLSNHWRDTIGPVLCPASPRCFLRGLGRPTTQHEGTDSNTKPDFTRAAGDPGQP